MNPDSENRADIVEFLLDLFARRGAEAYMGEPVTMAQHMEQSAACAIADGASDELVVAALLHDVGHFVGDFPLESLENGIDNLHEEIGAQFLATYFPPAVTEPIRLHVPAKRYLCAVDEAYQQRLSAASVNSLMVQGGPMSEAEIEQFEANSYHRDAVQVRLYDDDGKVAGLDIRPITDYRDRLESLVID